jgi:uncharacterized membrane protein
MAALREALKQQILNTRDEVMRQLQAAAEAEEDVEAVLERLDAAEGELSAVRHEFESAYPELFEEESGA